MHTHPFLVNEGVGGPCLNGLLWDGQPLPSPLRGLLFDRLAYQLRLSEHIDRSQGFASCLHQGAVQGTVLIPPLYEVLYTDERSHAWHGLRFKCYSVAGSLSWSS